MADDGDNPNFARTVYNLSRPSTEIRAILRWLTRDASVMSATMLYFLISTTNFTEGMNETDYILWDRACRVLSSRESEFRWNLVTNWGNFLAQWALNTTDSALAAAHLHARDQPLRASP